MKGSRLSLLFVPLQSGGMEIKMKKWKMAAVIVLCLLAATVTFNRNEVGVYAYTQDEIDAAKAWLSANGYSPTRAGAEQAYQDYLNGKFGPVGGTEETQTPATTEVLPTETGEEVQAAETAEGAVATEKTAAETSGIEMAETDTEKNTVSEEETTTANFTEEMESTSKSLAEESTADMIAETDTELEDPSEAEAPEEGFMYVGRYDGIIVVLAVAVCAVMGFFTYRYIKKTKAQGTIK